MLNRNLNEEFEIFKRNAADKSISCEIVAGHVVQSVMTGEDGHKLCFLLGTILEDYLMIRKKPDQVLFGPVDFRLNESNIFQPGSGSGGTERSLPKWCDPCFGRRANSKVYCGSTVRRQ